MMDDTTSVQYTKYLGGRHNEQDNNCTVAQDIVDEEGFTGVTKRIS